MDLKNKTEWSSHDILQLIENQTEENIHLDFKSAGSLDFAEKKKNEISKDVSAFANSDGGVIIYGLSEKNHVASSLDYIDGNTYTKEWLELVISGGVQRPIKDLRIYPVRFNDEIIKSIYVVTIPQSYDAPHMTRDKKFYRRYNFQSVCMEEYEVRNLYNRTKNASLSYNDIEIRFIPCGIFNKNIVEMEFSVKVVNNSAGIATLYKTLLFIKNRNQGIEVRCNKQQVVCSNLQSGYLLSSVLNPPIFPNEIYCSLNFILSVDLSFPLSIANIENLLVSILFESGSQEQVITLGHDFYEKIRYEAKTRGYRLPPKRRKV